MNYSYERVRVTEINELYQQPDVLQRNPFLRDSLLIGARTASASSARSCRRYVYNTVDQPIFPTTGKRFTASIDLAGLGGNTNFYKPMVEGVMYLKHGSRLTLGMRAQAEYIHPFTGSTASCRSSRSCSSAASTASAASTSARSARRIRQPASSSAATRACCSTSKSRSRSPARCALIAVLRRRPGAARADHSGPRSFVPLRRARHAASCRARTSTWQDFKTSTGLEVRFFMPVLNVPFRLIFAYNPQRTGVLTTPSSRRRRSSSGSPSARPSRGQPICV